MKKLSKILFLSVVAIVLLFFGFSSVDGADKTVTIKSTKKVSNFIANYEGDFVIYKTKNKKTVYGLEFDKKPLKKKQKLTFDKNADAGLLYILENGYPKSKITGDSATDKYITEAAIWWYMEENGEGSSVNPVLKNENNSDDTHGLIRNYIKPLVDNAIKAKNDGYKTEKASIKIDNKNYTLTLSENRKYYESNYISVNLTGASKYKVSSKAIILDENGNERKTFNASERFKIIISVDKVSNKDKISVTVKATGKENVAKIYTPSNDKYQSIVGIFDKKRSLEESFELVVTIIPKCKYLDGNYYDKDGNVTDAQTYSNVCNRVCKIVNENFYDEFGEETSKLIFDIECANSCTVKNKVHYGIDSRKVDQFTFEKECSLIPDSKINKQNNQGNLEIQVPDTNKDLPISNIIFGALFVLIGTGMLIKRIKL